MTKNILVLAGDGIGPEVTKQAIKLINEYNKSCEKSANTANKFIITEADIGGIAIDKHDNPFPEVTLNAAKASDAILLGAVGGHKWESLDISKRPEKGLLGIRKALDLFANLRPALVFNELADASSLKRDVIEGLDILIVRELTGGIYFGEPKGVEQLPDGQQKGYNTLVYTTNEVKRVAKVAYELAQIRSKKLCSIDKANVLVATEMWRNVVTEMSKDYADVELSHMYVDNAAMQLVRNPKQFDVVVTTNMFGDILSDCAAMLTGSLGMLPSASLGERDSTTGKQYSLYEPVHGSAPDIAGKDIANPIATILSLAMMFKYTFNDIATSDKIEQAIKTVLANGYRTADIMQESTDEVKITKLGTEAMGDLIAKEFAKLL